MFQRHGVILKRGMQIRLGGVPCIAGFGKKAQIRYFQRTNQRLFSRRYGRHGASAVMNGMDNQ
jgi:hypothetical protein